MKTIVRLELDHPLEDGPELRWALRQVLALTAVTVGFERVMEGAPYVTEGILAGTRAGYTVRHVAEEVPLAGREEDS